MSLINDALKKASQLTAPTPPPAKSGPTLRPLEAKRKPSLWPVIVFPALLLAILGLAGWFFLKHVRVESPVNASARESASVPEEQASIQPEPASPARAVAPAQVNTTLPADKVPTQTSNQTASVVAPAPPPAPTFKLQGIFYKPVQPLAMLNGRTVGIGDKVLNGKIVAIRRDSVSVYVDGQTKVLTLPTNN
jgi:hypothetical protein